VSSTLAGPSLLSITPSSATDRTLRTSSRLMRQRRCDVRLPNIVSAVSARQRQRPSLTRKARVGPCLAASLGDSLAAGLGPFASQLLGSRAAVHSRDKTRSLCLVLPTRRSVALPGLQRGLFRHGPRLLLGQRPPRLSQDRGEGATRGFPRFKDRPSPPARGSLTREGFASKRRFCAYRD
jgi:hypothetical protein